MSAQKIFKLLLILTFISVFHFTLTSTVQAQVGGTGAEVIRPIEKLWQLSRNISYVLITIVLMVIGLMIMLRTRINPQTVVGLQQALPGIIIALIMITFSYFIPSLIIDLAFLMAQVFGVAIVAGLNPTRDIADVQTLINNILNTRNIFNLFTDALNPALLIGAANRVGGGIADALISQIPGFGPISQILGISGGLGTAIATIVLAIGLISSFFRLFFALVTAFVSIILNTAFGPFLILFSALPGRGGSLTSWLRGLAANVIIFPVVFLVFVLVAVLLNRDDGIWTGVFPGATGIFNQPLPLLGNLPDDFIRFILAYGIILATPGIPAFIQQLMGAQTPQQLGQAVTQGTGAGQGVAMGGLARIGRVIGI